MPGIKSNPFSLFSQLSGLYCKPQERIAKSPAAIVEPRHGTNQKRVLDYLRSVSKSKNQQEIRRALNMRHASAAWSLHCLCKAGFVRAVKDCSRNNPRYLRYLVIKTKG